MAEAARTERRKGEEIRALEVPRRRAEDRKTDALRSEVLGIAVLAVSLCLFLALVSFHAEDLQERPANTLNWIGPVGAKLADSVLSFLGIAGFLLPVTLTIPGVCFFFGKRMRIRLIDAIAWPILICISACLMHLWLSGAVVLDHSVGGLCGTYGAEILCALFGHTGAYILLYSIAVLLLILTTRKSMRELISPITNAFASVGRKIKAAFCSLGARISGFFAGIKERRKQKREEAVTAQLESSIIDVDFIEETPPLALDAPAQRSSKEKSPKSSRKKKKEPEAPQPAASVEWSGPSPIESDAYVLGNRLSVRDEDQTTDQPPEFDDFPASDYDDEDYNDSDTVIAPSLAARNSMSAQPVVFQRAADPKPAKQAESPKNVFKSASNENDYELPSVELLNELKNERVEVDPEFLQLQAERLTHALENFRIGGQVTEIHPGPVVTMFEFKPQDGVRVSKIASLADDLAMALHAVKVRIEAPIPGKGVVGFEVPNETREMVYLREILESDGFHDSKHALPLALGKDIAGMPMVTDLAKMPHLLVAGTTGSGKSVGVNGMIVSLLFRYSPEDVRFIMIDPKMLELSIYEDIPHLLLPVVTDPKKAAMSLKWVIDEMERRYELMKNAGVRELKNFNRKVAEAEAAGTHLVLAGETGEIAEHLPYIVVVIDEFADLMMVAGKEIEHCVMRLAQKARAAGIHLILATQRPSVDVITGVIKANFPTRMAFQVSSGTDSRTILNQPGAENLLGKGDMLFIPPGTSRLSRVHGAFISDDEIHAVVSFIQSQREPNYLDESQVYADPDAQNEDNAKDSKDDKVDERYEEAVRLVAHDGKASASHLQRRMGLGYGRAARLLDQMEHDGLIGPANGSKSRVIHKDSIAQLVEAWDQGYSA